VGSGKVFYLARLPTLARCSCFPTPVLWPVDTLVGSYLTSIAAYPPTTFMSHSQKVSEALSWGDSSQKRRT
jgi:hypothetical protein